MGDTKTNLLDFDWEKEENFFSIETEETKAGKTPEKKEVEDEELEGKSKPKAKKAEEEEEEDDDFFEGVPSATTLEVAEPEIKAPVEGSIYNDLYKDLKETGIFKHVEIEEETELDAETFAELQEEEYELEISSRLKAWATEELDEDAKAFIKFKRDGGKTEDFFKVYREESQLPDGEIDDEAYQDEVIRYTLSKEGWDKDEIEDRLQYLSDSNRKEKTAKKYDEKIKELRKAEKEQVLQRTTQEKIQSKQQEEDFKKSIKDFLVEKDEIEGFKISKEEKNTLYNFLTRKEHKVSDTKSITSFQKKLAEVFQDTDKMVLLAKLIKDDFDLSDFESKVKTKKVKDIKTNLEQRKGLRPGSSGSSLAGSSLADFFN